MKQVTKIILTAAFMVSVISIPAAKTEAQYYQNSNQVEMLQLIQILMERVALLQQMLQQQRAGGTGSSDSYEWESSEGEEVNDRGPKTNVMNCATTLDGNKANGSLACYGLHDYGDEFGNDQSTCGGLDPIYENRLPTGCVIPAKMCASDRAIATEYTMVRSATDNQIAEWAKNFRASEISVRNQLVRMWEYECTSKPLTGLESEVNIAAIKKDYGDRNPDWDFVNSASDVLVVGAYEGSRIDNSIEVDVAYVGEGTLLVLAAYDPVHWKLSGAGLKNVEGIFVTGYHNQRISNVPSGVEVTSGVYEAGDSVYFYAYEKDSVEFYELQDYLEDKTGFAPYLFFGGYNPTRVNVSIKG